jgi:hypothetical protein
MLLSPRYCRDLVEDLIFDLEVLARLYIIEELRGLRKPRRWQFATFKSRPETQPELPINHVIGSIPNSYHPPPVTARSRVKSNSAL